MSIPGGSEYRLVGSQVVSHFGVDHTGKIVGTSGVDKTQIDAWSSTVAYVASQEKPFMLASHYPGAGRARVIALLLPLTPDGDGARKLFGGTFFDQPFPDVAAYPDLPLQLVALSVDLVTMCVIAPSGAARLRTIRPSITSIDSDSMPSAWRILIQKRRLALPVAAISRIASFSPEISISRLAPTRFDG